MVTRTLYQPTGPYIIQSGKYANKPLELLMFEDYGWVYWMLQRREEEGRRDNLYHHLAWLLEQGKAVRPKMTCPQCGERSVAFFSVAYSRLGNDFTVGLDYTYCEQCAKSVDTIANPKPIGLFSFRLSTLGLRQFSRGYSHDRIVELFKKVYGLPKPFTREEAFAFFSSAEPYIE